MSRMFINNGKKALSNGAALEMPYQNQDKALQSGTLR